MRGTLSFTPAAISTLVGLLLSNLVTPADRSIVDARPCLCNQEALQVAGDIARAYAAAGDIDHALVYQRRADAVLEQQLSLCVAIGSERQKLAFVRAAAERTDRTISLHLTQAPRNQSAASLAALVLLQRKGRVQDAMADLFASAWRHLGDPGNRQLMDQLQESSADLAKIAFGGARPGDPGVRASIAQLESRRDQLEASLGQQSAPFRAAIQPVTLESVQAAVPGDAALVEFAVFRPFNPDAKQDEDAYAPSHYAAYIILQHGAPTGMDLGTVENIDALVVGLRTALRDPNNSEVRGRGRALDEKVMRPLRPFLNGATRVLISPDGGLNLVPFETLVDEHGRYLIERYATTYVTTGRDLLRMHTAPVSKEKPVIVADPLFGEPDASVTRRASAAQDFHSVTDGPDGSDFYFAPLLGSALEARTIKSLFPDAALLTGRRATKAVLERMAAPSILHIASHGFFLDDTFSGAPSSVLARNPLLRSGLALAGANLPGGARGDGILTALEASSLNLEGTGLVTLSACDTGIGDVRNGEGAYGLRRAFMLAGAKTLVMSLWPVTDAVARDTMVGYYARLRAGFGRGDALRQTKLAMLHQPSMRHPYYWGGFIQSGDWSRLPTSS